MRQPILMLTTDGPVAQARVVALAGESNLERVALREPTLEEAYLKLVR